MKTPDIKAFFDETTNTFSYLVWDRETGKAAVIDPVLEFDMVEGTASAGAVNRILAEAAAYNLDILWSLETHAHADHLSGSPVIKARTEAKIGIGEHIRQVQRIFAPRFNAGDLSADGSDFDHLFTDGERFRIGAQDVEILYTPGHTPACISYRMGEAVFIGDTMFMPDYGTARADFPGGDARMLYRSIRRLLALPEATRLFLCHDYAGPGREEIAWETSVGAQRAANIHVHDGVGEDEFVAMREARDATLDTPRLLLPSIQTNIRAGRFPPAEDNGVQYLKIPVRFV